MTRRVRRFCGAEVAVGGSVYYDIDPTLINCDIKTGWTTDPPRVHHMPHRAVIWQDDLQIVVLWPANNTWLCEEEA